MVKRPFRLSFKKQGLLDGVGVNGRLQQILYPTDSRKILDTFRNKETDCTLTTVYLALTKGHR